MSPACMSLAWITCNMTERYAVTLTARFIFMALSLTLIALMLLMFVASTPSGLAMSTDRLADTHLEAVELFDHFVPPVDIPQGAWSPIVSVLALTAVVEWAWYPALPVHPPKFSH